jgi:ribosomal protein S18 acetylase RimI-like enzyme
VLELIKRNKKQEIIMTQITTFKKVSFAALIAGSILLGGGYWYYTRNYGISFYRPEDQQALTNILHQDWYWLVSEDSTDFSPEYMFAHRAAVPSYPDNSLHIIVYREQGKPVAFVTYYRDKGCRGRIQFVAVDQQHRKRGYAQQLIKYALDDAAGHGLCSIELVTRTNNISAQTLYRKLGFHKTWEAEGFVGFEISI